MTCTVYALKDLGDDPNLGKWVAETIPQMIQPGTWGDASGQGGTERKHRLSYYPQGKILVVYHTAAAHAEIAAFLDGLKKADARGESGCRPRRRPPPPSHGAVCKSRR